MVASLLRLAGLDWPVPDFSTLSRRQKTLAVQVPYRRADGPLNLFVDSTGIKFLGDGEWQARKHGAQARAAVLGPMARHAAQGPSGHGPGHIRHPGRGIHPQPRWRQSVLPELLGQIPADEPIGTVTADGAYDTRRCHTAIMERDAAPDHPDPQERAALER